MNTLQNILSSVDIQKAVSTQRSRDGVSSLVTGVAAGLALGYFARACMRYSSLNTDEAESRRRRVYNASSSIVTVPRDTVRHTRGWHTNSRGMVMCNQQFIPVGRDIRGVVAICHGFTDHTHGFLMDFAIKLCSDGYAVITMDVEVSASVV